MHKKNANAAIFIFIIIVSKKDEVMDKVSKQPMTHTGTHSINTNHQSHKQ
jgi:hypothetical protein